jgi:hypothetical protein
MKLRRDKLLPIVTKDIMLSEAAAVPPRTPRPNKDMEEPARTNARIDMADPMEVASKIEIVPANRAKDLTESVEPKLHRPTTDICSKLVPL